MKKALTITIAGTLFTIEEDAYQKLDSYLKSIQHYFGTSPESKEIINDIEARIAEQLLDRPNKDAVVSIEDVEKLISVMGRVEDIAGDTASSTSAEETRGESQATYMARGPRKLFRNPDDAWIMGVASGLAAYLDIDPLIVRLIFIILALITAVIPSIIIYLILAILIPAARTPAQKIQMRGGPVDLRSFKESMNEYAQEVKKSSKDFGSKIKESSKEFAENVKRTTKDWKENVFTRGKDDKGDDDFLDNSSSLAKEPARAEGGLVGVLRTLVRAAFKIVGFFIKLGAVLAIIAVSLVFVGLIFHVGVFAAFPLWLVVSWPVYYILITLFFLAAILPLALISMFGSFMMLKRGPTLQGVIGTVGTWFAVILILVFLAISYFPKIQNRVEALPEYQEVSKTFELKNFSKIDARGAEKLVLVRAPEYSVIAKGYEGNLEVLDMRVENDTLFVTHKPTNRFCFFCGGFERSQITIAMPTTTAIMASGATFVESQNELITPSLTVELSGASRAKITGATETFTVKLSGASKLEADTLSVQNATVDLSGASHASVFPLRTLNVDASGASTVIYKGSPQITQDISGASKIQKQ